MEGSSEEAVDFWGRYESYCRAHGYFNDELARLAIKMAEAASLNEAENIYEQISRIGVSQEEAESYLKMADLFRQTVLGQG